MTKPMSKFFIREGKKIVQKELQYQQADAYWTKTNCYDGKNCNGLRPEWWTSAPKEGDYKHGETLELKIDAANLPPGSKVIIEVPCCPKCGLQADAVTDPRKNYKAWPNCECGFSWRKFCHDNFS